MGSDNIYIKFGFRSGDPDTWVEADWTQTDALYHSEPADNIRYLNAAGGFYKSFSRNVPTEEWEMTVRMDATNGVSVRNHAIYVKMDDGYYYVLGLYVSTNIYVRSGWDKTLTRPVNEYTGLTPVTGIVLGTYDSVRWIGLRFKTDGGIDFIANAITSPDQRDPPEMFTVDGGEDIITGFQGRRIVEVGWYGEGNSARSDFYRIKIDADPYTPLVMTGSAKIFNLQSVNSLQTVGGGGACTVVESYDPYDSNALDHVRDNARKTVVIYRPDGVVGFKGEIDKIHIGWDTITYEAEEGLRKMNENFCGFDPTIIISTIKSTLDNKIYDYSADWDVNEFANKILVTKDNNLFEKTDFPSSVAAYVVDVDSGDYSETWELKTPANEGGGIEFLYFNDESLGFSGQPKIVPNVYGTHYINQFPADYDNTSCGHLYTFKLYEQPSLHKRVSVDIIVNDSGNGTLTRIAGGSWIVDGFVIGDYIHLLDTNQSNNSVEYISSLTDDVMTFGTLLPGSDSITDTVNVIRKAQWDNINVNVTFRSTSLKGSKVHGSANEWFGNIAVRNYQFVDSWTELELFDNNNYPNTDVEDDEEWNTQSIEDANNGGGKSPVITKEIIFAEKFPDAMLSLNNWYMDIKNDGDLNDNGFIEVEMQIRIRSPVISGGILYNKEPKLEVHYLSIEFDQENTNLTPQGQQVGAGVIASNDEESITLDGTSGWEISSFPQGDGVTLGDEYIITETIQDVLDTIFDADPVFSVDYTIATQGLGEIEDLTYTPKFDVIQKYSDMLNLVFWYEGLTDTIVITDDPSSSGITLTIADVIGWNEGSWRLSIDASNIREKIVYIGDEGITVVKEDDIASGGDYDVEYDGELGDEAVIYRDNELFTYRNVDESAESKVKIHSVVRETIPLPIDLDPNVALQDYTALTVGSTVAFTGSILGDYDGDDELMVESISLDINFDINDKMSVVFNLQKRVI